MRLAEIERRLASLAELSRIVGAMRSISSMRVQEAVKTLAGVRAYGSALEDAVRTALAMADAQRARRDGAPRDEGRRALVVLTSEHGFVGAFNERLLDAAAAQLERAGTRRPMLMLLGSRGAALARERGLPLVWTHAMATRRAGVPDVVRALQERLIPPIARGEVTRATVLFGRYQGSGIGAAEHRALFPLELPTATRSLLEPLHNLAPADLLERLTAEYLLASLTEAAVESLASENGARFAAMEAARDNVERKRGELKLAASQARQEEVTSELLDLATGAEAVTR